MKSGHATKRRSDRLNHWEQAAREAGLDKDLTVGAASICIKQERLYLLKGFTCFWDYVAEKHGAFRVGRRQAERLMRGHAVLDLLRDQPSRLTRERQVCVPLGMYGFGLSSQWRHTARQVANVF